MARAQLAHDHLLMDPWIQQWAIDPTKVVNPIFTPKDATFTFDHLAGKVTFETPASPVWHKKSVADTAPAGSVTAGGFTHTFSLAIVAGKLQCTIDPVDTGRPGGSGSPGGSWTAVETGGSASHRGGPEKT